jgi:uncharacterized protein
MIPNKKKILIDLKALLIKEFGDYIDKAVLFGSRALNTASKYSDYDILIILKKDFDWRLEDAILSLCYEIDLKYDIVTDIKVISRNDFNSTKGRQPFILNALEHGLMV